MNLRHCYLLLVILMLPFKYSYAQYNFLVASRTTTTLNPATNQSCCPTLRLCATSPQCSGGTGSITTSLSSAQSPISYTWNNGSHAANLYNIRAGSYTVTVTDGNGCREVECITLCQPDPICITLGGSNPGCNNTGGSVTTSVSGGTSGYSYRWSNGATSANISNLGAGTYSVTVTDAHGCTAVCSKTLTQSGSFTITFGGNNLSCNGNASGSITTVCTGGSGTRTYRWSNGATTSSISGLSAGTYSVTITDANGCSATASKTLTQPNALIVSLTGAGPGCNCAPNGTVTSSVTGGTAAYTYKWNTGATTANLSGLSAGTYTVTVTDNNHCTATATKVLAAPANLTVDATATNAACYGGTGSATAAVTGGTGPFTYKWSNGATTTTISGVAVGSYSVTVTDSRGCTGSDNVTVQQPTALSLSIACNAAACNGGAGTVNLTVSGGTPAYTYRWSNGATTQDLSGVVAGTYTVTVTDTKGCTATKSGTLTQGTALSLSATTTAPSCSGNTGAINLSVSGGSGTYTYRWSNNATIQDLTGLASGTYTVTVTDAAGCSATLSKTLTGTGALTVAINLAGGSCGSSTGTLNTTVTGGSGSYTYRWSNGATTANLSNVPAGSYAVTVTDASGCTGTANTKFTPQQSTLSVSVIAVNACAATNTGGITSYATGGTAPYTYSWTNSGTNSTNVTGRTTNVITLLAPGTYTVTVRDASGCTATAVTNVNITNVTVSPSHDTAICIGASAQLIASGADLYSWSPATGLNDTAIHNPIATPTQTTTYTVTASSFSSNLVYNGDFQLGNVGFTSAYSYIAPGGSMYPEGLYAVDTASHNYHGNFWGHDRTTGHGKYMIVNGAPDSNVVIWAQSVTNILPNTNYYFTTWASSQNTIATYADLAFSINGQLIGPNITSPVDTNHWIQFYAVWNSGNNTAANISIVNMNTIRNGNDFGLDDISFTTVCQTTAQVTVTVNPKPVADAGPDQYICAGGRASLTATGAGAGGSYLWSNGSTTATINVSPIDSATTYKVTVTNASGCTAIDSAKVIKYSGSPLVVSASKTDLACNGNSSGSATATVTGGTAPYTYRWSNSATTAAINGLAAGTYTVTVTSTNGCTGTASVTVTQPNALALTATATAASCNASGTGSIDLTVTGGTAPYTYAWSNGATTQDLTGLAAGTYTATVTDARGCTSTKSTTVTQPSSLALTATATSAACNGSTTGAIDLTVTGGTPAYTYLWSNAATTQDLTGLAAGTYTVTVTDAGGCNATKSATVTQPNALALTATTTAATCNGSSTGTVDLTVAGGTAPYTYRWSNGATTQDLTALAAGTYTVTVTDAHACTATKSSTIQQPNALSASLASISPNCNGALTGSISSTVTGGTTAYTYLWSNGATTANLTNVGAGTYTVTVTDANRCSTTATTTVTQPTALTATATATDVSCFGGSNGTATVTAGGGTAPYTYRWSNNATTATITGLVARTYSVTVTDSRGCTTITSTPVAQPAPLTLGANTTPVSCNGGGNGSIDLIVTGGNPTYNFTWSNGATTEDISNLAAGTYSVTTIDAHACSATVSIQVNQPQPLFVTVTPTNPSCTGSSTGSIATQVNGGTAPYTYRWSNGATTAGQTGLAGGPYSVTITDANGCATSGNTQLSNTPSLTVNLTTTNISCNGAGNGAITTSVTGSTTAYTYLWSNGATTPSLSNLAAGTYTLTVSASGCSGTATATITQPGVLGLTLTRTNVACNGSSTGAVTSTVTGGTAPYHYAWSTGDTTANLSGIHSGSYNLTVTDAHGCRVVGNGVNVTQPNALTNTLTPANVNCFGGNDGSITSAVNGGTAPYTYAWSNGSTNPAISGLRIGRYYLTVTDARGCSRIDSATITQPGPITLGANTSPALCAGGSTGSIILIAMGPNAPFTYAWSNGATTKNIGNLTAGDYTVTVTNTNGCRATVSITVLEPQPIAIIPTVTASCILMSNGSITTAVSGGTSPYTYAWSNGETTSDITGLPSGDYGLTLTDRQGCLANITETVTDSFCAPENRLDGSANAVQNPTATAASANSILTEAAPAFASMSCYPNPFSSSMNIEYQVPQASRVQVDVYDHLGNKIVAVLNNDQAAGKYKASFESKDMVSGLYYITVQIGDKLLTQKAMLVK